MDKNGKIGGKVSIIDILVVVLVVAVIVGIVAIFESLSPTWYISSGDIEQ